jgi:hypothetical protein
MLTAPATPTITASGSTNIGAGGSVTLTSSSATSYLWVDGTTTQALVATSAGNYRVTATGTNGCKATSASKVVTSSSCTPPAVPTITSSSTTNILVNGGTITLTCNTTTGGWLWSNGATTRAITVGTGGTFTVRNYSAGSCYSTSLPVTVYLIYTTREAGSAATSVNISNLITYPNPSNGQFNLSFSCEKAQSCLISIYDISGRLASQRNIETIEGGNLVEMNLQSLAKGLYLMRLSGESINDQLRLNIE